MPGTQGVATVQGDSVHIYCSVGVTVEVATVSSADILSTNGVIHVIDKVILPK